MQFPLDLAPDDNGTWLVTCPALPEVTSYGETREDALHHGREAVEEALGARLAHWQVVALPDRPMLAEAAREGRAVRLSLLADLTVTLYLACRAAGVTLEELARRMGVDGPTAERLFRLDEAASIEAIDAAFTALGRPVEVVPEPEAA